MKKAAQKKRLTKSGQRINACSKGQPPTTQLSKENNPEITNACKKVFYTMEANRQRKPLFEAVHAAARGVRSILHAESPGDLAHVMLHSRPQTQQFRRAKAKLFDPRRMQPSVPLVAALGRLAIRHPDAQLRLSALDRLNKMDNDSPRPNPQVAKSVYPQYVRCLQDQARSLESGKHDEALLFETLRLAGLHGPVRLEHKDSYATAVMGIATGLLQHETPKYRQNAAAAIGNLRRGNTMEGENRLIEALKLEDNPQVAQEIIQAFFQSTHISTVGANALAAELKNSQLQQEDKHKLAAMLKAKIEDARREGCVKDF